MFVKHDQEKPRTDLIPPRAIMAASEVLGFGARKYSDDNWRKGGAGAIPRYLGAALRHIFAHMHGEVNDPESDLPHLAHALTCLLFALELFLVANEEKRDAEATFSERPAPGEGPDA